MKLEIAALSDIGNVRGNNEDNLYHNGRVREDVTQPDYVYKAVQKIKEDSAYAVFDGMGGLAHGEEASLAAGIRLREILAEEKVTDYEALIQALNQAVCKKKESYHTQIGTTAAILFLSDREAVSVNVGDSRIYFFRDGELKQLSKDHTERNSALEMQAEFGGEYKIDLDRIKDALTQHLGIDEEEFILEPEVKKMEGLREGDVFLLCSDGLWNLVIDLEIKEDLKKDADLLETAERLRDRALRAGGNDNITIILLRVMDVEGM